MSRDAQNNAQNTYNTSSGLETGSANNANNLYGQLNSAYSSEAANPQGFSPTEVADMNTSAQQSAGGSMAGAVGQANLQGAANRNSGSFAPAIDDAARGAQKTLSSDALGVQNQNALLKESQRQSGLAGLSGLQGEQNNDVLSSLGLENSSNNSLIQAGQSGWFQNMLGLMNAGANAGKAVAGVNNSFSNGGNGNGGQ